MKLFISTWVTALSLAYAAIASPAAIEEPPLVRAIDKPDVTSAERLLASGADPNLRDARGRPLLILATQNLTPAVVDLLLQHQANPNLRDQEGQTPLMAAAYWTQTHFLAGQEERAAAVTRSLIASGAHVNATDPEGITALMRAAGWHHPEVAKELIAAKANLRLHDRLGRTALTWAARDGAESRVVRLLIANGAAMSFADALLLQDRVKARELLAARGDVTPRGGYEDNTLMMAAEFGYGEIVRALLARRLPFNARDREGNTALILAIAGRPSVSTGLGTKTWPERKGHNRLEIVTMLLKAGADPNLANENGETALAIANEVRATDVIPLLARARPRR